MKTNMLRFGCVLVTATLATGAFAAWDLEQPAGAAGPAEEVAIRLSTEHTALSLNEPVVVHLHFHNLTSAAMPFDLGKAPTSTWVSKCAAPTAARCRCGSGTFQKIA